MKGHSGWSYRPYRPPMWEAGDPYICRIVPSETSIHVEWLDCGADQYEVYYRRKGALEFCFWGAVFGTSCDITGLRTDTDYEFYVNYGENRSRTRLARCGASVGTVVNYLHPDDQAYSFSGHYLCSPSLLRHPDGYLLSSMDVFDRYHPQNLTMIFRSDDDGENWYYVCDLMPCFWGKLFLHKGEVYMLGCSTQHGDLLIGKSTDGGMSFGSPVVLLRGSNGKHGHDGYHKNPQPVLRYNGRLYETLEWGSSISQWHKDRYDYAAMVMSCDENDDLLVPENWSFTEPVRFDPAWAPELVPFSPNTRTLEGCMVVDPQGRLLNIMRFENQSQKAIVYEVDPVHHEAPLRFLRLMDFPANRTKFEIKYDTVSGNYYTVGTRIYAPDRQNARNLSTLLVSRDLVRWRVALDLFDYRHEDHEKVGFQYVDFEFEGDDMIFLCRVALNNAHNLHDTNYQTYHKLKNFRSY